MLPTLWRDELIAGASHCDFESPTDWMCRLACGETDPARQQQVRQGLLDAAARWLRGGCAVGGGGAAGARGLATVRQRFHTHTLARARTHALTSLA